MTSVSGLGTPRPPYPPAVVHRARPAAAERTKFDALTRSDRELIFNVTGERVFENPTAFAALLAAERAAGHLAPGQEATAVYLKDLSRRYERTGGANPVAPFLDKAVDYLGRGGTRRIDVSA